MQKLRSLLLAVLCLCAAAQIAYCAPAQERSRVSPPSATLGSVSGTVINSVTGAPLNGVHVRLTVLDDNFVIGDGIPSALYGALSDAAGRFSIAALPASRYGISLERRDFIMVAGKRGLVAATGELFLKAGEQVKNVRLRMAPRAIISGRVLDEHNDPLMGVEVAAVPVTPRPPLEWWKRSPLTNDRGEFRLSLPPGRYYIVAKSGGIVDDRTMLMAHTARTYESTYHDTYYPGVTNTATATPVEAKPGGEVHGLEIRLVGTRDLNVSGVVMGTSDCVSDPTVLAEPPGTPTEPLSALLDSADAKSGARFLFSRFASGLYKIYAECSAGKHVLKSQMVELTLTDSNVENLSLMLDPGADIKDIAGKLDWSGPPQGAQAEDLTVNLVPKSRLRGHSRTADVGLNGTFEIKDVFPDRYVVEVESLPTNTFIKTLRLNGIPVPDRVLDLTRGVADTKLRITLSRNGGQVTGRVTDDEESTPSSFGIVVIFPDQEGAPALEDWCQARLCEILLGPGGRYGFDGLAPGRYRLLAARRYFQDGDKIGDFVRQNRSHSEVIEFKKEGDKISKDLRMPAGDGDETKQ